MMPRYVLYEGLYFENFLPESRPLLMIQLLTSFIFFYTSALFLGSLLMLTFPSCILMIIDPRRIPLRRGFYSNFVVVFDFISECSYPSSFLIQFYDSCNIYVEH